MGAPDGSAQEVEEVLNPGVARDRAQRLLLYPRMVAAGNVSRIGLMGEQSPQREPPSFERGGFVLEPQAETGPPIASRLVDGAVLRIRRPRR